MQTRSIVATIIAAVVLIVGGSLSGMMFENVDADQIVVIQSPAGGLSWYTSPGWKWQGFGKVTAYQKRSIYHIAQKMRFNDGAHGVMTGSIQYELPVDSEQLTRLHMKFGSQEAVAQQLIQTVVNKSVYMTGPLMTSKESYAEKRNALINYIEDQVARGVYQTTQRDIREKDEITGELRTRTVVEIVTDKAGVALRQEEAVLGTFGVKTFNFSIDALDYEDKVEAQIAAQQQATMDVQTAIAQSKKAEQDALTVAKQGEAMATKSRWQQEIEKAREVTRAQQVSEIAIIDAERQREVAKLAKEAAEQTKQQQILLGQGEAERKRLVLAADGALSQKLEAWTNANGVWANAYANRKVPQMVFGGAEGQGGDMDTSAFMSLIGMKAAKDLALDMSVPRQ